MNFPRLQPFGAPFAYTHAHITSKFGIIPYWDQFPGRIPSRARKLVKSLHSPEHAKFCAEMIAARKKAGLTQEALASRLKQPQSFVAKYEGGERPLDVIEFLTIANAIGADPLRLIRRLIR